MQQNREFIDSVIDIVGRSCVLTRAVDVAPHSTGWRFGGGSALAVIFPQSLYQQWQVLQQCVKHDVIVLMQASNTGLTGGSTPMGDDYDRPVVLIKAHKIHKPYLLENGSQVVAFPGTALYELEDILKQIGREPHSVIGSSCIGASVIGGVCNNSGGALLQRGPAYTELALYAQLDDKGELHLVNNTGIDLGDTPEDMLHNIEHGTFQKHNLPPTNRKASGTGYSYEVRQIDQPTPARFNANPHYLYETSGSAGKLSVFAVRLDTFEAPKQKKLFYLGTDKPEHFHTIRRHVLGNFENLPVIAEYLNATAFDQSRDYARDVIAILSLLGPKYMPFLFRIKRKWDAYLRAVKIFGDTPVDKVLQWLFKPFKFVIPKRILKLGKKYDHHLFIEMSDAGIAEMESYLIDFCKNHLYIEYIICNKREHQAAVDVRFAAGNGMMRYEQMSRNKNLKVLNYDVAYPRNADDVIGNIIPAEIDHALYVKNHISHFFCHVTHQGYLVDTSKCDVQTVDKAFKDFFKQQNAMYPAEHNFGNMYPAPDQVQSFYKHLDPCNSFNAGIGQMSKCKHYKEL